MARSAGAPSARDQELAAAERAAAKGAKRLSAKPGIPQRSRDAIPERAALPLKGEPTGPIPTLADAAKGTVATLGERPASRVAGF